MEKLHITITVKLEKLAYELANWGRLIDGKSKRDFRRCRAELEHLKCEIGWGNADEFVTKKFELGSLLRQRIGNKGQGLIG